MPKIPSSAPAAATLNAGENAEPSVPNANIGETLPKARAVSAFAPLVGGVPAALLLALAFSARPETFDLNAPSTSLLSFPAATEPVASLETAPREFVAITPRSDELRAMAARGEWPRAQTVLAKSSVAWSAPLMILPPVLGRAPMSGQVSRVSVRVGQSVAVDDAILELSGGPTSRVDRARSGVERRQSAAEKQQVEAANKQAQLQQKMIAAQIQLKKAQDRVVAAQDRVEQARGIVARLQRGETVQAPGAPKPQRTAKAPRVVLRRTEKRDAKNEAASRAAQELEAQARAAQSKAAAAKHQVELLESRVGAAQNAVQSTKTAAATAQKRFDDKEIKAAELDAARAAHEEAEAHVKSAASELAAARGDVTRTLALADAAQSKAKSAAKEAGARPLREMTVFGDDGSEPETSSDAVSGSGSGGMSVTDAARLARSALNESAAAVAEARRIKNRVELYANQVAETRSDISSSSRALASAQNDVLDQTIEVNLSAVRAPAAGVVQSIAAVADSVSAGDTIVTIAREGRLRATWTDDSGAWRKLRLDQTIPIEIAAPNGSARAASARISDIAAQPNGTALVEATVFNPRAGAKRLWQAGWQARALVPSGATTQVPQDALVGTNTGAGALMRVAVLAPVAGQAEMRLQWRNVRLQKREASGELANHWAVSGVRAGERVALNADALPSEAVKLRLVG